MIPNTHLCGTQLDVATRAHSSALERWGDRWKQNQVLLDHHPSIFQTHVLMSNNAPISNTHELSVRAHARTRQYFSQCLQGFYRAWLCYAIILQLISAIQACCPLAQLFSPRSWHTLRLLLPPSLHVVL